MGTRTFSHLHGSFKLMSASEVGRILGTGAACVNTFNSFFIGSGLNISAFWLDDLIEIISSKSNGSFEYMGFNIQHVLNLTCAIKVFYLYASFSSSCKCATQERHNPVRKPGLKKLIVAFL